MKRALLTSITFVICVVLYAQTPRTFNLQGVLLDSQGQPTTQGDYIFKFRIYDAETLGNQVGAWEETQTVNVDGEGLYQVVIGKVTPISTSINFDIPYWIEIEVSNEVLGRMELTGNAYVLDGDIQDLADGTLSGSKVGTGINGANLVDASVTSEKISGDIAIAEGGTGASDAAGARTNLGIAIGSNVQAYDADLDDLADGSLSGSKVGTGIDGANLVDGSVPSVKISGTIAITEGGTGASDAATARTNLGLAIGSNVQAYDADLIDLADGSLSGSKVGTGINASNLTTGTVNNSRLDADLQDLADGSLSGSKVGSGINGDNISDNTIDFTEIQNNSVRGEDLTNALGISYGLLVGSATESTITSTISSDCNCIVTYGGVRVGNATSSTSLPSENDLIVDGGVAIGTTADVSTYDLVVEGGVAIGRWGSTTLPDTGTPGRPASDPFSDDIYIYGDIWYRGTISDESDRRLKENIQPLEGSLDKLLSLNSYSYYMKEDSIKKKNFGLIAQEVREIYPEIVTGQESENTYLGVSYIELIPILIQAVKEQQEIIKSQDERIAELNVSKETQQSQIDELSASIDRIEAILSGSSETKTSISGSN